MPPIEQWQQYLANNGEIVAIAAGLLGAAIASFVASRFGLNNGFRLADMPRPQRGQIMRYMLDRSLRTRRAPRADTFQNRVVTPRPARRGQSRVISVPAS